MTASTCGRSRTAIIAPQNPYFVTLIRMLAYMKAATASSSASVIHFPRDLSEETGFFIRTAWRPNRSHDDRLRQQGGKHQKHVQNRVSEKTHRGLAANRLLAIA